MDEPLALRLLWAKTDTHGKTGAWHPLICHMLDVAAVTTALWQEVLSPAARRRLAGALGLSEEAAGRWLAFWAGLHDLGKAAPSFAINRDKVRGAAVRAVAEALPAVRVVPDCPHGEISARLLRDVFEARGLARGVAWRLAAALGGHHGVFPAPEKVHAAGGGDRVGGGPWEAARRALVDRLAQAVELPAEAPSGLDTATATQVAGLTTVADWIASAAEHFPLAVGGRAVPATLDLAAYAQEARAKALAALRRLGWLGWTPHAAPATFADLFPDLSGPRPVQTAAVALARDLGGPALVVVEAPMGEGKTEAAMYLADHWGASLGVRGCYFALPTQATSNQMFGRVRHFLARRYGKRTVNLQLVHGHAVLSAEFEALRSAGDRAFAPTSVHDEEGGSARDGVAAAEWFTYRKRGLLAPFGVGTVDQALLAVLQTRHVFVRLCGLAQKTVIVDEVHAYDTYMTQLLERLVEWLAGLGSPVVLLSATLPAERRQRLAAAYAQGLGREVAEGAALLPAASYPRVSWLSERGAGAQSVATSPEAARRLGLRWVDGALPERPGDPFPLGEELAAALVEGGCAAVICNTVRRAQEVYRELRPYFAGQADDGGPTLDLLHARYPFKERDEREKRALLRFGKPGGTVELAPGDIRPVRRPGRAVLVSTQIVEQSLDLDFDLMVTDLAPADLLLQRSGRLWRHPRPRPAGLSGPRLWVCQPEAILDGVPHFGRGSEAVYDPHVLLRSWLALRGRGAVAVPEEVEALIEEVYGERACPAELAEPLRQCWSATERRLAEQAEGEAREAEDRWIKRPSFDGELWKLTANALAEDEPGFHQAHQALTRLTEPTAQLVCLWGSPERPCLDQGLAEPVDLGSRPTVPQARRLLERSVSISDSRAVAAALAEPVPPGWRRSALLRHHRALALDESGRAVLGDVRLRLDPELGLLIDRLGE